MDSWYNAEISGDSFSTCITCDIPIYLIFEALIYLLTKTHEI
jgi:hypothetical protein